LIIHPLLQYTFNIVIYIILVYLIHTCNIKNIFLSIFNVLNTVYKRANSVYSQIGDDMDLKKNFGQRIKEIRIQKGYTQYKLAELVDIDPKHMSHIETGRSFPKADLIEKFARALDIDYTQLFKAQHLQKKDELIKKIDKYLMMANEEQIKLVYKIVESIMD